MRLLTTILPVGLIGGGVRARTAVADNHHITTPVCQSDRPILSIGLRKPGQIPTPPLPPGRPFLLLNSRPNPIVCANHRDRSTAHIRFGAWIALTLVVARSLVIHESSFVPVPSTQDQQQGPSTRDGDLPRPLIIPLGNWCEPEIPLGSPGSTRALSTFAALSAPIPNRTKRAGHECAARGSQAATVVGPIGNHHV